MTLPTFLGIGVPRGGSTWLSNILASHPDIYVPTSRRRDVQFFNRYYERGLEWYESFFPSEAEAGRYRAIGEFSSDYFYFPAERIASVLPGAKLILILRNPIDRLYSAFGHFKVQNEGYSGSFEGFLSQETAPGYDPAAIECGFYGRHLQDYCRHFGEGQILVMIFEQAVTEMPQARETLARFLEVEVDRFPPTAGARRANRAFIPRARFAYALAVKVGHKLWDWNLEGIVSSAKRLGIERLFGDAGSLPPMKLETREYLREVYEPEIRDLEALLQIDLAYWR
jgi:hypothetical protein